MENNLEVMVTENDDGRWEDVEWLNNQAELSACEDTIQKGLDVA